MPSSSNETFETMTLFAKIGLAIGATLLLFLNEQTVAAMSSSAPTMSLVSEVCLGATFVASVLLVAVWDSTLAVLVCLFLACWVAAIQNGGKQTQKKVQARGPAERVQDPTDMRARSEKVSGTQAAAIQAQAAHDNAGPLRYSMDTPLPNENEQTSIPMAYAMADRSYSTPDSVQ